MKITFIDARQADAAVIQIDQDSGEPFTIVVDGGDTDDDLEDHLPSLMTGDPTVELLVLSHPHDDHSAALDWLIEDSGFTVERAGRGQQWIAPSHLA
jgi:glyoxylase-like metal-dependent hydrolase (beta-lactamase superfamily II)